MKKKLMDRFRLLREVVKRSGDISGFLVVPKCWIGERKFAWFNWNQRLNEDDVVFSSTSVYGIAMMRIMVRSLDQPF